MLIRSIRILFQSFFWFYLASVFALSSEGLSTGFYGWFEVGYFISASLYGFVINLFFLPSFFAGLYFIERQINKHQSFSKLWAFVLLNSLTIFNCLLLIYNIPRIDNGELTWEYIRGLDRTYMLFGMFLSSSILVFWKSSKFRK